MDSVSTHRQAGRTLERVRDWLGTGLSIWFFGAAIYKLFSPIPQGKRPLVDFASPAHGTDAQLILSLNFSSLAWLAILLSAAIALFCSFGLSFNAPQSDNAETRWRMAQLTALAVALGSYVAAVLHSFGGAGSFG